MRVLRCLLISIPVVFLTGTQASGETDPLVEEMVALVSQARVTSHVQTLQDFGTRYTYTQGNTDAGNWLCDYFGGLGVEVERHEFTYGSQTEENIIGRIPGLTHPDEIIIISGHFDCTSQQPNTLAPGADDDASAIAAVLEAADIFKDFLFERTIEFIAYNAEEQGRRGSIAVANDYLAAGKNIVAVVNADMIGYWPTGWGRDLDVAYEPNSEWLADQVISACNRYVQIPIAKHLSGACRDDHYSFTTRGISAVTNMDCWDAHNGGPESTPHYHRTTDTISTLNLPCMTQAIQVSVASVAELALPLSAVDVADRWSNAGDAGSLHLATRPNPFRAKTAVDFSLPEGGRVSLRVYDASGRRVRTLTDGIRPPGNYESTWSGTDNDGHPATAGVYYLVLETESERDAKRVTLLR